MSKIFGILTILVLAAAAFIGVKNKAAYQEEIANRQTIEANLGKSKERLEKATTNRDRAIAENNTVKEDLPKVQAQKAAQEKINAELATSKETKSAEFEGNKAKLDQAREKTSSLGNIKDLATKMGTMLNEVKAISDSLGATESRLASLTNENSRVEALVARQQAEAALRNKGESFPTLKTRISAVYPNWGFVTLAAGNSAGVITNSTLDVVRDDEVIAKLLVTAVERNTSSASIIPDTVKGDTVLSAGDQVVPGVKVTPAAPTSAAPAPAPAN